MFSDRNRAGRGACSPAHGRSALRRSAAALPAAAGAFAAHSRMTNPADANLRSGRRVRGPASRRRASLSDTMLAGAVWVTALVTGAATPARADGSGGGTLTVAGWSNSAGATISGNGTLSKAWTRNADPHRRRRHCWCLRPA